MNRRTTNPLAHLGAHPVGVGLIVTVLAAATAALAFTSTNGIPVLPKTRLYATLPADAVGVRPGLEIRVAGQYAGVVDQVQRTAADRQRVRMVLRVPAVGRDAELTLRLRAPAGGRYLALRPGNTQRPLPGGGAIPAARVHATPDLLTVVDGFDAAAIKHTRNTIQLTGAGVLGRGTALGHALAGLDTTLGRTAKLLRAATPAQELPGLINAAAAVTGGLAGQNRDDLGHAVTQTADVLEQTADAAARLADNIKQLPQTEQRLLQVAAPTRRLLADTSTLARRLPPAVTALHRALPALDKLVAAGPMLTRTLPQITSAATPALTATAPVLARAGISAQLLTQAVPKVHELAGYLARFPREIDSGLASYYVPFMYRPLVGKAVGYTAAPVMLVLTCAPGNRATPEPGSIFSDRLSKPCH